MEGKKNVLYFNFPFCCSFVCGVKGGACCDEQITITSLCSSHRLRAAPERVCLPRASLENLLIGSDFKHLNTFHPRLPLCTAVAARLDSSSPLCLGGDGNKESRKSPPPPPPPAERRKQRFLSRFFFCDITMGSFPERQLLTGSSLKKGSRQTELRMHFGVAIDGPVGSRKVKL